jgi:hypothetical protein
MREIELIVFKEFANGNGSDEDLARQVRWELVDSNRKAYFRSLAPGTTC